MSEEDIKSEIDRLKQARKKHGCRVVLSDEDLRRVAIHNLKQNDIKPAK